MNLANKLTLLRVLMIPAFLGVLYWGGPNSEYIALAIFVIASLTDFLDGYIARSRGLVTDFGKFMDPLADKVLVTTAMLWFVQTGVMPAWAVAVVIFREFAISGIRLIAGKAKESRTQNEHFVCGNERIPPVGRAPGREPFGGTVPRRV